MYATYNKVIPFENNVPCMLEQISVSIAVQSYNEVSFYLFIIYLFLTLFLILTNTLRFYLKGKVLSKLN